MRGVRVLLLLVAVGCGSETKSPADNGPEVEALRAEVEALRQEVAASRQNAPAVPTLKLEDVSSVKAFLEEELEVEFEPLSLGYGFKKPGLQTQIWRRVGSERVHEIHIILDPLTERAVERCVGLTRRILTASGEDPGEVERKTPLGKAAFRGDDPEPIELEFSSGAYVRFSVWERGESYKMAGVVISPR